MKFSKTDIFVNSQTYQGQNKVHRTFIPNIKYAPTISYLARYNKYKLRNDILACQCKVSKLVLVCVKVTHLCLSPFCFLAVQTNELLPLKTKTHLAAQPKQVIKELSMLLIYSFRTIATSLINIFNIYHFMYHCKKMKFSIKHFFSKCDQIRSFLRIWSHLMKKSLLENFIFCAMYLFAMIFSLILFALSIKMLKA